MITNYGVALITLMLIGILMRLQFAGLLPKELSMLQLRQAHSHLGFFGVLVPMTWMINQTFSVNSKYNNILYFYVGLVITSFFSFLDSGYNVISHIASGLIFGIWIFTLFKIESHDLVQLPEKFMNSILLICSLAMVIIGRKFFPNLTVDKLAHGFVFNLLFLIITPSVVKKIVGSFQQKTLWLAWWFGCLLMYLHEINMLVKNYGALILALIILSKLVVHFHKLKKNFFYYVLTIMALGLLYLFTKGSEVSYQFSIAMIHFVFLSFLTTYFLATFLHYTKNIVFFVMSSLMSALILAIDFFPEYMRSIHLSLALIGTGLMLMATEALYNFIKKIIK